MNILTSYFANMRNLKPEHEPYCIARFPPKGIRMKSIPLFFPSESLLRGFKAGTITEEEYREIHKEQLHGFEFSRLPSRFQRDAPGKTPVLLCYEGKGKFCHRHVLAEFINALDIGIRVDEL